MELALTCVAWLAMLSRAAGENNLTALFHEALSNDGSLQSSVGVSGAMSDLELVYLRRHPTPAPPTIVLSARDKRSGSAGRMSYFFSAFGRNYNLKLEKTSHLVSPGAKVTVVGPRGGVSVAAISPASCHYIHVDDDITAALNACKPGTIAGYIVSRDVTLEVRPLGKRAAGELHHAFRKRGAWPSSVHRGIPHVVKRMTKDSQAKDSQAKDSQTKDFQTRPNPTHMELEIPPPACSESISNATPDDLEFGQGELFTIPPAETSPVTPALALPGSTPIPGPSDPPPTVAPGRPIEEDPEGVFIPPLPFKRSLGQAGDSLSDREPKPMGGFHREPKPVNFDYTPSPPGDREPKPMQGFDREPRPMNRVLRGPPGMDREPKPMQGMDREPKPMREPGQGPELPENELNREPKPMQGFDREPRPMNQDLRGPPGMDREPKPMQGMDREPKPMREPGQEPELPETELNREPKPMQGFDREPRPMNRGMNRVLRGPPGMDREPKPMQGMDREPKPMREPEQGPVLPDAELNREPKPMQGFDREPRPMNRDLSGPSGMDREPKPMQGFDREPRPMNRDLRGPPGMDREPKPMQGMDREPKPMREPGQEPELPETELNREPKPMQGFDREPRPMNRDLRGASGMDREPKPVQGFDREPKPMREPGQGPELPENELNREPKPMQGFDREPRPMREPGQGPELPETELNREPKPMQGFDREPKPMREPGQGPELPETELNREPKPMQGMDREPRVTPTKRNGEKTVELGVFVDQAAHDLFLPYLGSQAALTDVVLGYVNGIQALFHHPSLGQKIHLAINHIEIMAAQPSALPHYGGHREQLYDAFRLYNEERKEQAANLVDGRPWDMGILISGLNFYSVHKKDGRTSYSTMGLAAVRGVCHPGYSAVIVELGATDTWGKPYPSAGFASVYVMAHEMGHNLGMLHDGYGNACPKNGFVMSASRSTSGETNWSSCSREVVETLSAPCLNDNPPEIPKHDHSVYDQLPGQTWDAYDQCRVFLRDDDATLYNESLAELHSVCNTVMCRSPHRIGYFKAGPALDGTYCGAESWCVAGSCTPWPPSKAPDVVLGGWSSWQHTGCESGCIHNSTGVQMSKRACSNPKPRNTEKRCSGVDATVNLCDDSKVCQGARVSITEYAVRKCDEFSNVVPDLKPIGAMAPHNPERKWQACAVFCQRSSGTWYSPRTDLSHLPHFAFFSPDGHSMPGTPGHKLCRPHHASPRRALDKPKSCTNRIRSGTSRVPEAPRRAVNKNGFWEVAKIFELTQNMDPLMLMAQDQVFTVEQRERKRANCEEGL
ncbi:uncharacterized protein LOC119568305 [Penaeus monodon]|uniref:uncharacterized protein LOC119568305 n=1 Tax=Penaeus monodon TaxID=6687 RepID=UPI0018A72CD4|nr:uncharacterized protein LOC119568305 [Penaeus monodon]